MDMGLTGFTTFEDSGDGEMVDTRDLKSPGRNSVPVQVRFPANKYYVYAYIDPRTMHIKYIGKGTRDRASVHWTRARTGVYIVENKRLTEWLKELISINAAPIIVKLVTRLTEAEAFDMEAILINFEKRNKNNNLLNKKKGGTN